MAPSRLTLISADTHIAPTPAACAPFVEPQHRSAFEAWRAQAKPTTSAPTAAAELLASLSAAGIAAAILFPNPAAALPLAPLDSPSLNAPELQLAGARAYNRWLADFCSRDTTRLTSLAILPLQDLTAALAELHWAAAHGLRGVLVPTITDQDPQAHPLYSDRHYDPVWSACEETGLAVHTHPWRTPAIYGTQAGSDFLAALEQQHFTRRLFSLFVQEGVFERHPRLRLVMAHQGARWVPPKLAVQQERLLHPQSTGVGEKLSLRPADYWARNCWLAISDTHREDVDARFALGFTKLLWGADDASEKTRLPALFSGVPEREVRAILGENAARLYILDMHKLTALAQEIGPSVADLTATLAHA